ncbi:hypothetical protein LTR17_011310 [Elasticomyces elasticus]|nr:hypothetical protein LTR17_011310 [Elasticomyces elasticus]
MGDGGVGVAGLILAIPGLIDLSIKYGEFLKDKVTIYREAQEISRLSRFVTDLARGELFQTLRDKLETVKGLFPSDDPSVRQKLSFSMRGKRLLDEACGELESWSERFFRLAVVFLFFGGFGANKAASELEQRNTAISRMQRIRGAFSDEAPFQDSPHKLRLVPYDRSETSQVLTCCSMVVFQERRELAEYRMYGANATDGDKMALLATVRDLARRLSNAQASHMGHLTCLGFSDEESNYEYALRFQYPATKTNPRTLQDLLADKINARQGLQHSITDRYTLACKLASAVLYLHAGNFVHKNIRPTNVLIFDSVVPEGATASMVTYPRAIGEPYLVGFDGVRKSDAKSKMLAEDDWKHKIYLHPTRHRMAAGDEFTMRHDVFSLGVVLLEIAIWTSFTDLDSSVSRSLWSSLEKGREQLRKPDGPEGLKERFVHLARSRIPRYMGDRYRDVVLSCLQGLEDEEKGGLLDDEDGIVAGSAYISQVIAKLEDIHV